MKNSNLYMEKSDNIKFGPYEEDFEDDYFEDYEEDEENEEDLEWSQTSWDRNPYESDEDYEERMEDLDNMLDGWL